MFSEQRMANVARTLRGLLSVVLLSILVAGPSPAAVEPSETGAGRTPPRLSLIVGSVSFWRPGTADWVAAQLNMALAPGDALYAGSGAHAEVQIGGRAFVRLGNDTQLAIVNQEPDFVQFNVSTGHAGLDLRELERGHGVEIDTPNAAVTIEDAGYYRFDVSQDTTTLTTRRSGRARVQINGQPPTNVGPNDRLVVEGTDVPQLAVYNAPATDEWDRWNYDRTDWLLTAESSRYLPRDVYGAETLDDYGTWQVEPTYGRVWVPSDVSPDWAPYSTGQWSWDPYYGWTWVDAAPWGWAPFHYGRWVHLRNCWGWAPGPPLVRPVYAPGLVAFFGGGGVRVGIGTPFVSWVALGWGEPLVPWWGPPGFIGVPCWRGWGGPRVVNNVFVNNTTIVNVHQPTAFANTRVRNAVITVPRDGFGAQPVERLRTTAVNPTALRPLGGELPRPASFTTRHAAPDLPHGGAATASSGFDAPRSVTGGRRPDTTTTSGEARLSPPASGGEQGRQSSPDIRQAPHGGPLTSQQRPSMNEPPPPPQARRSELNTGQQGHGAPPIQTGAERQAAPGHNGGAAVSAPPDRQPPPPPGRAVERAPSQGSFSAQPPSRFADRPAPPPMSAPPAPPADSGPVVSERSYSGPSGMTYPHAPPAARGPVARPGGVSMPAAPAHAHAPHASGGTAPASRGSGVSGK